MHRRASLEGQVAVHLGIPVTTPICTLIDIAPRLTRDELEAAVAQADKRDLTDPDSLRAALDDLPPRPGIAILRDALDRRTFTLTESQLERLFLRLARRAGLGLPLTGEYVRGHRVDFYWPELGLVVETDGLRYHRTPAQQARDRRRDQDLVAAGLTPLRFTHGQVRFEPDNVVQTLIATVSMLGLTSPRFVGNSRRETH